MTDNLYERYGSPYISWAIIGQAASSGKVCTLTTDAEIRNDAENRLCTSRTKLQNRHIIIRLSFLELLCRLRWAGRRWVLLLFLLFLLISRWEMEFLNYINHGNRLKCIRLHTSHIQTWSLLHFTIHLSFSAFHLIFQLLNLLGQFLCLFGFLLRFFLCLIQNPKAAWTSSAVTPTPLYRVFMLYPTVSQLVNQTNHW